MLCASASMRGYGCGSVVVVGPVWLCGCASKVVWLCQYNCVVCAGMTVVVRVCLCCAGMTVVVWLCRYGCVSMNVWLCGCAGMTVWLCCMCRYGCVVVAV